ncbi:hypothetical protein FPOA_13494 [Fusarium poae]|uniref:Uncharacterized protein n=1 Tax=Fusarium poae TaxID=36050 RepID=A0A1B8A5H5_FUSPO|nr:hypothetical protein FPOA_13494 [Fusarium poae]
MDSFPTLFLLTYQLQCHKRILDPGALRNDSEEMSAALEPTLRSSWQTTAGVSALAGVLSHHIVFRPYEIDGAAWNLVFTYIGLFVALCIVYAQIAGFGFFASLCHTLLVATTYNVSLTASILVYRAFFHRLRSFPGPFMTKLSRFDTLRKVAKTTRGCEDIQGLHKKYGNVVRIGPRELSINLPSAIPLIYGSFTRTKKSLWYEHVSHETDKISVNSTCDPEAHKKRKLLWERALGFRAMKIYETGVTETVNSLLCKIAAKADRTINITKYSMLFSFDVIGVVGFSKDFHMVESETEHPAIKGVHESMMAIGVLGTVPWLLSMLGKIPGAAGGYARFTRWCHEQLQEKRKIIASEKASLKDQDPQDIMSWLVKAMEDGDPCAPPGDQAVEEDARLLIIAGSDTVASAITNALYYLAKNPDHYQALQDAIWQHFPNGDSEWTYKKARAVLYLDWVIYETLRLRPSVPGGLTRVTPPEGLVIDDFFIPGDIVVSVPTYTMQRDERYWPDALSFKPERWKGLSTEMVPWIPFTKGQGSCPGKALAIMEMRMVLGRIALLYNISFPKDVTAEDVKFEFKDTFTMKLRGLNIVFTPTSR